MIPESRPEHERIQGRAALSSPSDSTATGTARRRPAASWSASARPISRRRQLRHLGIFLQCVAAGADRIGFDRRHGRHVRHHAVVGDDKAGRLCRLVACVVQPRPSRSVRSRHIAAVCPGTDRRIDGVVRLWCTPAAAYDFLVNMSLLTNTLCTRIPEDFGSAVAMVAIGLMLYSVRQPPAARNRFRVRK